MTRLILWLSGFGLVMSLLVHGATSTLTGARGPDAAKGVLETAASSHRDRTIMVDAASRSSDSAGSVGAFGETTISRDSSGHFSLYVTANGQQLPFLVDTGADKVALTVDSARAIGLYVDPTGFEPVAMGAGGPVRGQHVTIDRLEIGNRSLTGVDAMVLEGLGTNLLGQSALAQLGGVEMRGDRMVLR